MAVREAAERDEIPLRAWRGAGLACALIILICAAYPRTAGAGMIFGPTLEPRLESHEPFLFQLLLPQVDVNREACNFSSAPDAEQPAATTPVGTGGFGTIHNIGPAPWLVLRSDDFGLAWIAGKADEPGTGRLTATASLAALGLLKARLARIENCQRYLLHLLEMINKVVLAISEDGAILASGDGTEQDPNVVAFMAVAPAVPMAPGSAGVHSEYVFQQKIQSAHSTVLNLYRRESASHFRGKADTPSAANRQKRRVTGEKISIRKLVIDIFSNTYTYVVIFMVTATTILLQRRMR